MIHSVLLVTVLLAAIVMTGCTTEPSADPAWQSMIYVHRDEQSGMCTLKAHGKLLESAGKPRVCVFLGLWKYDLEKKQWEKFEFKASGPVTIGPVKREVHSVTTDATFVEVTDRIGLFWAKWQEDGRPAHTLVFSGPVSCNDLEIGTPPKGMIAACVPLADSGLATFVPDPEIHCRP